MNENYPVLLTLTLAGAAFAAIQFVCHRRSRMQMPPGPVGYPIIGNLLDLPKGYDPRLWATFKDTYGTFHPGKLYRPRLMLSHT